MIGELAVKGDLSKEEIKLRQEAFAHAVANIMAEVFKDEDGCDIVIALERISTARKLEFRAFVASMEDLPN